MIRPCQDHFLWMMARRKVAEGRVVSGEVGSEFEYQEILTSPKIKKNEICYNLYLENND